MQVHLAQVVHNILFRAGFARHERRNRDDFTEVDPLTL